MSTLKDGVGEAQKSSLRMSKKNGSRHRGTGNEGFSQDYCNRGERLNSALPKQKAGEFLSNGGSWYRNLQGRYGGVQSMGVSAH